jgi:hypothetical protein
MADMLNLYISRVDIHRPKNLVGRYFNGNSKIEFDTVTRKLDWLMNKRSTDIDPNDLIDLVKCIHHISSIESEISGRLLSEIGRYLRLCLLSREICQIRNAIIICDTLVKNCGNPIHKVISKRYFMMTFAIIIRRLVTSINASTREIGKLALYVIQGWGEAFEIGPPRHDHPNIFNTYFLLRIRYQMPFGPQHDPSRIPIFIGDPHSTLCIKEKKEENLNLISNKSFPKLLKPKQLIDNGLIELTTEIFEKNIESTHLELNEYQSIPNNNIFETRIQNTLYYPRSISDPQQYNSTDFEQTTTNSIDVISQQHKVLFGSCDSIADDFTHCSNNSISSTLSVETKLTFGPLPVDPMIQQLHNIGTAFKNHN